MNDCVKKAYCNYCQNRMNRYYYENYHIYTLKHQLNKFKKSNLTSEILKYNTPINLGNDISKLISRFASRIPNTGIYHNIVVDICHRHTTFPDKILIKRKIGPSKNISVYTWINLKEITFIEDDFN